MNLLRLTVATVGLACEKYKILLLLFSHLILPFYYYYSRFFCYIYVCVLATIPLTPIGLFVCFLYSRK